MRLVTDETDDAVSGNQTIDVELADTVRLTYRPSDGPQFTKELSLGRPTTENNNGANQRQHDIREVKTRFVVFRNQDNTGPAVTRAEVEQDIEYANDRLAQSTIRLKVVEIDMGDEEGGVTLPAALEDGYTATPGDPYTSLTDDETAVIALKDGDDNSIDFFYVEDITNPLVVGASYYESANQTGDDAADNFIVLQEDLRTDDTLGHEIMHVLLNSGHRANEPETALFVISGSSGVEGSRRIGPYPDAATSGVGNDDTATIRSTSESLP